jgi:hypothetical protein
MLAVYLMNWFNKLLTVPISSKIAITAIIFLIGLKFGMIILIFLPFLFFPWKRRK